MTYQKNYNQKSTSIDFNEFVFDIYDSIIPYEEGIEIMNENLYGILQSNQKQKILLLEHEDVYSAGRMTDISSEILNPDIKIHYTDRGGRLTYHGPGQRVIYPILDLNYFQKDIKSYIGFLQNLVINTLYNMGINSHIDRAGIGVWTIKDNDLYKIASIGIKVKKWIAYHGIAINIFNDLDKFDEIIPCGIKDYKHISLKRLGVDISFKEFDSIFIEEFGKLYRDLMAAF